MEKTRFDEELNTLGITLSERQKEQFDTNSSQSGTRS